jgi:tetratricopeptide (TPR) repeat protein
VFNLANVLYALAMKEEASERHRQAVELDPGCAEAWNNLGITLTELNRFDEAIDAFQRAIALQYFDAHYNLADLLESLGRRSAAREHWRAVVRHDSNSDYGKRARKMLG